MDAKSRETAAVVMDWLRGDELEPELLDQPGEAVAPWVVRVLIAAPGPGLRVRLAGAPEGGRVDVSVTMRLAEEHFNGFNKAGARDQLQFWEDFLRVVFPSGLLHALGTDDEGNANAIRLERRLYESELERAAILHTVRSVHAAGTLFSLMLQNRFAPEIAG